MSYNSIVLDYSYGDFFYLTTPSATNFTSNIINFPNGANRNYTVKIIIDSSKNKVYCNQMTISMTNIASSTALPMTFTIDIETIIDSSTNFVNQEF